MNKLLNPIKTWVFNIISRVITHLFSAMGSSLLVMLKPAPIPVHARKPHPSRTFEGEFRRIDEPNRW